MYGLRGNRAREKTALMPDPLRRSSFGCTTLDSRRMDMDMVRPRKDPWGLSPVGGPWEAWGSLMDLCGRSRPAGPPRSSCDAYVGRVCHCHCGGDRSSRHPVRLVWVNGSFGCRTIAARTRDFILDTILAVTNDYSFIPVLLWDLGSLRISLNEDVTHPPFRGWSWVPAAMRGVIEPPPGFALRRGVKRYPEHHDHGGAYNRSPVH